MLSSCSDGPVRSASITIRIYPNLSAWIACSAMATSTLSYTFTFVCRSLGSSQHIPSHFLACLFHSIIYCPRDSSSFKLQVSNSKSHTAARTIKGVNGGFETRCTSDYRANLKNNSNKPRVPLSCCIYVMIAHLYIHRLTWEESSPFNDW